MYKQDYGCRLIKWEFDKTFFLTKKVLNDGSVEKKIKEGNDKVKYHDQIFRKYWESWYQDCK